ncbi:DsbE family thiol:disulfide interchange protein [bacterium]|nr:DsbE family thiol:disulfide interchange protein [bacterium]
MAIRPLILLPPLAFVALAAAFWVGMQKGDQPLPSMTVGHPAPNVRVVALGDGPAVTDADLRKPGVKLLNFWASWCEPCRAEHPMLEALQKDGATIYGINYKDKPADALKLLSEMGSPYALLGADAGPMALDWGVYGVPETYVIDGKGMVVLRLAGPITAANLESTIKPAMAKAAAD